MAVVLNPNVEPAVNATVTIASLPVSVTFPTAQEIIISDADDSVKIGNGSGTYAAVTVANALKVDGSAVTQPISGTVTANTGLAQPLTDAQLRATPVPISGTITATPTGTQDVNVVSSVEIEIKNDTGNPVPVNGAVTANAGTGNFTVVQATGTNLHAVVDSGTVAATQSGTWNIGTVSTITNVVHVDDNASSLTVDNAGTFAVQAAQSGTWTVQPGNTANTTAWKVDGSAVTQPISGTVTANAGTNLNTSALALDSTVAKDSSLSTLNTSINTLLKPANTLAAVTLVGTVSTITNVVHIDDNAGSITVDGALTASPASGSLTNRSGNATNVSSQVMAANASRKYMLIQNSSGVSLWIDFGVAAVTAPPSIEIKANGVFTMEGSFISTQAVNIIKSAAASTAYTAKEG